MIPQLWRGFDHRVFAVQDWLEVHDCYFSNNRSVEKHVLCKYATHLTWDRSIIPGKTIWTSAGDYSRWPVSGTMMMHIYIDYPIALVERFCPLSLFIIVVIIIVTIVIMKMITVILSTIMIGVAQNSIIKCYHFNHFMFMHSGAHRGSSNILVVSSCYHQFVDQAMSILTQWSDWTIKSLFDNH